jgi:hypothetical protein
MKLTFPFLLLLMAFLFSCEKDGNEKAPRVQFKNYGLENKIIFEFQLVDQKLYAATNDGLFVKNTQSNTGWEAFGLQGKQVQTFVFLPNNTCLASVPNQEKTAFKLYRRNGTGAAFQEVLHNFGGDYPESLNNFLYLEATGDLLATGNDVIARSTDLGSTWTPIHNEWQQMATGLDFVKRNPHNGDLWAGGQNAIEGFNLHRYSKSSDSWHSWSNLLPPPSVAKDIAFHRTSPGTLIIGAEDGIIKTEDNGATWTIIKQDDHEARFYFGVDFDEVDKNKIYAASWQKDFDSPQPLILYISRNAGKTWQEFRHQDPSLFGGVWDMVQVRTGNKTKLYLGLYKGGVYEAMVE